jgi:hypothetical protein
MQEKTIACLKYGTKYSYDYVNRLYSMTKRHCTKDYQFICFTDDSFGLNKNVKTIKLKEYEDVEGWWYKTFLFDPSYNLNGEILFIDLDVVIFNCIDKFFDYSPNDFCILRGFSKNNYNGMNSSCFKFKAGTNKHLYTNFISDRENIMKRLRGDQDWFQESLKTHNFWPDNWALSYKWNMKEDEVIKYNDETSIAVFHGNPKPHQEKSQWVIDNWR